jgi:hypothetical protein
MNLTKKENPVKTTSCLCLMKRKGILACAKNAVGNSLAAVGTQSPSKWLTDTISGISRKNIL